MIKKITISVALILLSCFATATAQEPSSDVRPSEPRVALSEPATAFDIEGRTALGARLRTTQLAGTPDSPERNTRIVIENRSAVFYTYAAGWATFYGADNVRCGEGHWKLEALAPAEQAEVDTPGLRLTCTPTTWRIVAANLLTRTTDAAKPADEKAPPPAETPTPPDPASSVAASRASSVSLPPLEISINGKTVPIQPGNPLEVVVGRERVRIVLQTAP